MHSLFTFFQACTGEDLVTFVGEFREREHFELVCPLPNNTLDTFNVSTQRHVQNFALIFPPPKCPCSTRKSKENSKRLGRTRALKETNPHSSKKEKKIKDHSRTRRILKKSPPSTSTTRTKKSPSRPLVKRRMRRTSWHDDTESVVLPRRRRSPTEEEQQREERKEENKLISSAEHRGELDGVREPPFLR